MNILVVEKYSEFLDLLKDEFNPNECEIYTAISVPEAKLKLKQFKIDVLVCSATLIENFESDLIEYARDLYKKKIRIILTSCFFPQKSYLRDEVDLFIDKNGGIEYLVDVLTNEMRLKKHGQSLHL